MDRFGIFFSSRKLFYLFFYEKIKYFQFVCQVGLICVKREFDLNGAVNMTDKLNPHMDNGFIIQILQGLE